MKIKFRAVWQQNGRSCPHTGVIGEYTRIDQAQRAGRGFNQGVQVLLQEYDGLWHNVPHDVSTNADFDIWLDQYMEAQSR